MRRFLVVFVLLGLFSAPLPATFAQRATKRAKPVAAAATHGGADQITAEQLKNYLYFIASDEMEGRDTPSRGLDTVARFLALNLTRWGFKPAGDNGTFFQHIALSREKVDPEKTVAEVNGRQFHYGEDFLCAPTAGTAIGELVYVGTGWFIKDKNIDPYKGIDVKDKIIVFNGGGLPKGVSFASLQQGTEGVDYVSPIKYAAIHGARGAIIIPNLMTVSNWANGRRTATERGTLSVDKFKSEDAPSIPVITASVQMFNALFQGEKPDANEVFTRRTNNDSADSFVLNSNKRVSFTVVTQKQEEGTQNVVAVWEGSDPVLKNEYVALGAHYDHVGMGPSGGGRGPTKVGGDPADTLYNGADDDGSGTTALLAMAEALSRSSQKPKRSILFIWHCGEEKGLWGSEYFTKFPTIPLDKVVTQLNIDMIGRSKPAGDTKPANAELSGPDEIYVIGSKMMSTELGTINETVNKGYLNLNFNYKYDDPNDSNRFFFRSDHFNYAQKGVPIIFYFDGVHEDYHRPSDSPDKIDYTKMQKVTRTVYATMWDLANRPTRPVVDKQLPKELTGGR